MSKRQGLCKCGLPYQKRLARGMCWSCWAKLHGQEPWNDVWRCCRSCATRDRKWYPHIRNGLCSACCIPDVSDLLDPHAPQMHELPVDVRIEKGLIPASVRAQYEAVPGYALPTPGNKKPAEKGHSHFCRDERVRTGTPRSAV